MQQIFLALLLIGAAVLAIKIALIFAFLIGLMFRPKETIGILGVLTVAALIRNYPAASAGSAVAFAALYRWSNRRQKRREREQEKLPDRLS